MRYLISEKISPHRSIDNSGYLICTDAILARTGIQDYYRAEIFPETSDWNTQIHVDRPYDEVFNTKALASFENKPVTIEHPDEDVNPENYKEYTVGFTRDIHQGKLPDGTDVVLGTLVITDQDAIEQVQNKDYENLSCGYDCDFVGDDKNMKQTNIRGNHVALCKVPRAGITRIQDSVPELKEYRLNITCSNSKLVNDVKNYLRKYDYNFVVAESKNALDMSSADEAILSAVKTQISRQYPEVSCELTAKVTDSSRGQKIERNKVIIRRGYHNLSEAADQFKDVYKIAMKNSSKMNIRLVLNTLETMYIDAYDDAQQDYEKDIASTAIEHYRKALDLATDFLAKRRENLTEKQAERMNSYIEAIKKLCESIESNAVPSTFKSELMEMLDRYDDETPLSTEEVEHNIDFSDNEHESEESSEGDTTKDMVYKSTKDSALDAATTTEIKDPVVALGESAVSGNADVNNIKSIVENYSPDMIACKGYYEEGNYSDAMYMLDHIFKRLTDNINHDITKDASFGAQLLAGTKYLKAIKWLYDEIVINSKTADNFASIMLYNHDIEANAMENVKALAKNKLYALRDKIKESVDYKQHNVTDSIVDTPPVGAKIEYNGVEETTEAPKRLPKISNVLENINSAKNLSKIVAAYTADELKTNLHKVSKFIGTANVANRDLANIVDIVRMADKDNISRSEFNDLFRANEDKSKTYIGKLEKQQSAIKTIGENCDAILNTGDKVLEELEKNDIKALKSQFTSDNNSNLNKAVKALTDLETLALSHGDKSLNKRKADFENKNIITIGEEEILKDDIAAYEKALDDTKDFTTGQFASKDDNYASFQSIPFNKKKTEKEKLDESMSDLANRPVGKKKRSADSVTIVADSIEEGVKLYKIYKKSQSK